jgi:hypothetical protein
MPKDKTSHSENSFVNVGKYMDKKGKESKAVVDYKDLFHRKNELFDVYAEDPSRRKIVQNEWGVSMSEMEYRYYEDQKTERKMICSKGVDPVWYYSTMRAQRLKDRQEEYRQQRDQQFMYKTLDDIDNILAESGDVSSHSRDDLENNVGSENQQVSGETEYTGMLRGGNGEGQTPEVSIDNLVSPKRKRRKVFENVDDVDKDPLPPEFQHIRETERKVRDDFYRTVANLTGKGLSIPEACLAIIQVGNSMFGRNWKSPADSVEYTVPTARNIRTALQQIEAQSLCLVVDKVEEEKQKGKMITHASDSTTKKGAGQFMVQGLHVGQNNPFPLPILSIHGETTEDIAMQVDMGFEILASVRGVSAKEVYSLIDTHMTDSAEHNKGFAKLLAEMYDLDEPAGQIFCGTHTTPGFSSAMNKVMRLVEADMKLEQVIQGFMADLEVDSKNASVAGQALDMCLKLVAPEYTHKPWNHYKEFLAFLERRNVSSVLFAYKDNRFGCLSRAAAVLIYNYDHLSEFLAQNPHINNRLACLVREVLALPYLKVALVVFACLGVHLVEPFYAKTIERNATHSQLGEFYKKLHSAMDLPISEGFTRFVKPEYPGITQELFDAVKKNYNEVVLQSFVKFS